MSKFKEVEFKLFGLQHEKDGAVRADIFAKKLGQFIDGLKSADKFINGQKSLNYLITDLEYGSAVARISEAQISNKVPIKSSSIELVENAMSDIRDGKRIDKDFPPRVLKTIADLGNGSHKEFSHGEIDFIGKTDNVVRIDDFFDRRADKAFQQTAFQVEESDAYSGVAFVEYSGTVKEVDLRGTIASAKLFLTAGGAEIDCICNSVSVDNLASALDHKVMVSGKAFYDGQSKLPERIDINNIRILKADANLLRWEGRFHFEPSELGGAI